MSDSELRELLILNLREEKIWGSVNIIRKLGKMKNVWALKTLLDSSALSNKFPVNRIETKEAIISCIRNLGEKKEQDADQLLVSLLKNVDDDIRYESVEALRKYSKPLPLKNIINLLSDIDWRVRENALQMLSQYPLDETLNLIISSCQDKNSEVKQRAVVMLGDALDNFSDHQMYNKAFKILVNCLQDDSPNVRAETAYYLGRIGEREALEPLKKALENEMSEWAEAEIEGAIQDISNKKNL